MNNEPRFGVRDVFQMNSLQELSQGDIAMVRNDAEHKKYGDHFVLVHETNRLEVFPPLQDSKVLNHFYKRNGSIILKLSPQAKQKVIEIYLQ